jgi:hypothetical protein
MPRCAVLLSALFGQLNGRCTRITNLDSGPLAVSHNLRILCHQVLLKRRSLIETVFDELKSLCQIEHTRHRSHASFIVNLMSGIITYCLLPNKHCFPSAHAHQHANELLNRTEV